MPLTVIHQGTETVVDDQTTALIGSDATSTIRIVRPGISRRHALISHDGTGWKIEDAGSRNGTFVDGKRVTVTSLDGSTTCYLGHPTDGEKITLVPGNDGAGAGRSAGSASAGSVATDPPSGPSTVADAAPAVAASADTAATRGNGSERTRTAPPTRVQQTATPRGTASASDVEIAQLTSAIRDQVKSIRNLTWSVWAMIAVTAILIVLTLFVGILSN